MGAELRDFPVQVSVDKQHILYGQMSGEQFHQKVGLYFPDQNKFCFVENFSSQADQHRTSFEGFQKDFFADIWREYLDSLPVDFEGFSVQSLIFNMHFFNEALFFYLYGAFKLRSLEFFKDNLRIVQKSFYWEDSQKAETYFQNLEDHKSGDSSDKESLVTETPDQLASLGRLNESEVDRRSSLEFEIPALPSGLEESDDDDYLQNGQQATFIQLHKHEAYSFEKGPKHESPTMQKSNDELLKERFSAIEEESHMNDYSRDNSRADSQINFLKMSRQKESSRASLQRTTGQLESKPGHSLSTTAKTGEFRKMVSDHVHKEYNGFEEASNSEQEIQSNGYQSSSLKQHKKGRTGLDSVSKSLNGLPPSTGKSARSPKDSANRQSNDLISQNLSKIKNSFKLEHSDAELDYADNINRSSTLGFNKYMNSSSKVSSLNKEDKLQIFELETGRMSQKNSKIYSQGRISHGSRNSQERRGSGDNWGARDEVEIEIENETLDGVDEIQTHESFRYESRDSLGFDSLPKPAHNTGPFIRKANLGSQKPSQRVFEFTDAKLYSETQDPESLFDRLGRGTSDSSGQDVREFLKSRSSRQGESGNETDSGGTDQQLKFKQDIKNNFGYSFMNHEKKEKKSNSRTKKRGLMGSQSMQDFSKKKFAFISQQMKSNAKLDHFYSKQTEKQRGRHMARLTPNESILEEGPEEEPLRQKRKKILAGLGRKTKSKSKSKRPILYEKNRKKLQTKAGKSRGGRSQNKSAKKSSKSSSKSNSIVIYSKKKTMKSRSNLKKTKSKKKLIPKSVNKSPNNQKGKPRTSKGGKTRTPAKTKKKNSKMKTIPGLMVRTIETNPREMGGQTPKKRKKKRSKSKRSHSGIKLPPRLQKKNTVTQTTSVSKRKSEIKKKSSSKIHLSHKPARLNKGSKAKGKAKGGSSRKKPKR